MALSPKTHASLEHLAASGHDLLHDLEALDDTLAADNVRRYIAILTAGRSANDALMALRGVNLLTTVNKGVGDTEASSDERPIADKAFAVTRNAIEAAGYLRADAGLGF